MLFLNNVDTDIVYGVFVATSDGGFKLDDRVFGLKYPYQVKVESLGNRVQLHNAEKLLSKFGIKRNIPLYKDRLVSFLKTFIYNSSAQNLTLALKVSDSDDAIQKIIDLINNNYAEIDIEDEIPLIETTTFWDFPKQSYGLTPKGNNKYAGVTPALIIYNLIWRYTNPGDIVVDPMCGSGTTIDVCKEEKRKAIGYDIASTRPDIIQNDARHIPLENNSADLVFIDSPYSDNIKYNEHPDNIGNISCESEQFYDELERVMVECHRILKDEKVFGWLIGDQWVKKVFTPVGFKIYERLCRHFEPVDLICISRRGQYSHTGLWHNRARRFNFYLRGFKYLIIVRKTSHRLNTGPRKIDWAYYTREEKNNSGRG